MGHRQMIRSFIECSSTVPVKLGLGCFRLIHLKKTEKNLRTRNVYHIFQAATTTIHTELNELIKYKFN